MLQLLGMKSFSNPKSKYKPKQFSTGTLLTLVSALVLGGLFMYGYTRISSLSDQVEKLSSELASSTALLAERTDALGRDLTDVNDVVVGLAQSLIRSDLTIKGFQGVVGDISGRVSVLDKLSKTDPELLQKYSKVYFLNEHYAPIRLVEIENQYLYTDSEPAQIHALVSRHVQNLLRAAQIQEVPLYVKSAYRSFDEQKYLKSSYAATYGAGTANQFSADQGYSEHQLGTTVDFITTGLGGQLYGFENTQAYQWMQDAAYKYGFVLSYPANNTSYIFEPWHWRYVGIKLAVFLHEQNKYFYDLEQREIDEYLVNIFD